MAKLGLGKNPKNGPVLTRREEVRRTLGEKESFDWLTLLNQPRTYADLGIAVLFLVGVTAIVLWAQGQPMVAEGLIMRDTHTARTDFEVLNVEGTNQERTIARQKAPRIYRSNEAFVTLIRSALLGLPGAISGVESISDVQLTLRESFALTTEALTELGQYVDDQGNVDESWQRMVERVIDNGLMRYPLISDADWQRELTAPTAPITLRLGDGTELAFNRENLVHLQNADAVSAALAAISRPVPEPLRNCIMTRIRHDIAPSFTFDEDATRVAQDAAAAAVSPKYVDYKEGHIIYTRGDVLSPTQLALLAAEFDAFRTNTPAATRWLERLGILGIVAVVTLVIFGYFARFQSPVLANPSRLLSIILVMLGLLALTVVTSAAAPIALLILGVAPTLLLGIILVVVYGQRVSMTVGALYAVLVCLALKVDIGFYVVLICGLGASVWQLREIRDRNRLIHAGAITGITIGVAAVMLSLMERSLVDGFIKFTLIDALGGAGSGLVVGIFMLGILSSVERIFNVTTGLTLVELRDPKSRLLRELQHRAPGTWNHSLMVANIAEAAADAIGADSLLAYVGALYHDIGKMNKPAYFVENQVDGQNRHEKLSPAMSLLIIVGHVKDGIEMAREEGLPRPLHHFIEAHHGTTLVEYFYHVAKERAESGDTGEHVAEVEYRYPGPGPRTKEVAILMLADAVESASRTMSDPTPSRIEQLVRGLGQKRLLDHQFDDCDLTLRELRTIEDSIIKSLCAIHHTRISYPKDETSEEPPAETQRPALA